MNFKDLFRRKSIEAIFKDSKEAENGQATLSRYLTVTDLTALAIAAIIGAGIFGTIGNASFNGGPAVSLMFVFTAIACAFSAMCYAAFASSIPISGSAYTYAYASLGEIIAWIIGWDLLMEYAVGNIAVAISWSDYFTSFLSNTGIHFPDFLSMDYYSALKGHKAALELLHQGTLFNQLPSYMQDAYKAWTDAPVIGNIHLVADIPAFTIVVVVTIIVFLGIRESKIAGNIMVLIKLIVILMVIGAGIFYVKPSNWKPFAPNGLGGVLKSVSAVFFAYIGFDAISSTAEECKNPQRDLPRAMIYSLIICTLLYILISLVLTGMVSYKELSVGDPLSFVFQKLHLSWISGIVAMGAIIAMTGVLLVFQVGQPRIWMSMSRDGLLPKRFGKIHPRFHTPAFSTVLTGIVVAIPSLFMNITEVTDLTSIGTLFAFVLVCAGVLHLDASGNQMKGKFRIPYVNSAWIVPLLYVAGFVIMYLYNHDAFIRFFDFTDIPQGKTFWSITQHKIPLLSFIIIAAVVAVLSIIRKYSLIPVIGLLINLYLMTELGITNWMRFVVWLAVGLVIYFAYSIRKSKLNKG